MAVLDRPVEAEARLRAKNQITLPEPIVRALDAAPDDVLLFEMDPADPAVFHARLLPRRFAGSLTGVFGTAEETLAFVRGERAAWGA
jgi:bifunctional DNA-binding transcriptional regulator/antitoxin component of YhaV-PrlF toxin-antitoxin module